AAAQTLAPVFLAFYKSLSDEALLGRHRFAEIATARLGPAKADGVGDAFLKQAEADRIISITGGVVAFTNAHLKKRLCDELRSALHSDTRPPLFEKVLGFAGGASVCLRTTTALRDEWTVALAHHGMRETVRTWCANDARADSLPEFH